jgi:plasmid stabilization system protein ParE
MKVRYERGALADLDEIFSYVARDNEAAAAAWLPVLSRLPQRSLKAPTWVRRRNVHASGDFRLETI